MVKNKYFDNEVVFKKIIQQLINFVDDSDALSTNSIFNSLSEEDIEKIEPIIKFYFEKGFCIGLDFYKFLNYK